MENQPAKAIIPDTMSTDDLARNATDVRARVAEAAQHANRRPEDVLIIAVTKTVALGRMLTAAALGFTVFGENRVQEAMEKQDRLRALLAQAPATYPGIRWELIGHLQSNKATRAVERFARIQSVDSLRLAQELERRAAHHAPDATLPILLEVNVAGEASKSDLMVDDVFGVARALAALPHLRPDGLMTVAPLVADPEDVRPVFRRLRELRDQLRETAPQGADGGWRELSMGMTDDYSVAIEEGATIVRIGRGIFGARPQTLTP